MTHALTSGLDLLAEGFLYPDAARTERLHAPAQGLPPASRSAWTRFAEAIERLTPTQQEELYTRTFDLNPLAAPYVGYQVYGEDYRRGAFLATLARELEAALVPSDGELADHVATVLRYLARTDEPSAEVMEVTVDALASMAKQLATLDRANPYRHLVRAAQVAVGDLAPERRADP